ncbi:hypothetical protein Pelo_13456 [Pelomyxa schiedti]|nr:hypothetical protein Pelo_13456 [Pelomyxa schiedti]
MMNDGAPAIVIDPMEPQQPIVGGGVDDNQSQSENPTSGYEPNNENKAPTTGILPTVEELTPLVKTRGAFQIHLIVCAAFLMVSFLVWFCVSIVTTWFPWFIGPMALCALSTTTHFYLFIRPREWFNCHLAWCCTLNCLFLASWLACNTYSVFPIYTFVLLGWALLIHMLYLRHTADLRLFALYCHSCTSIAVNIILFFVYLDTRDQTRFPWFIFPMMCGSLFFLAHYSYQYQLDLFTIHTYFFVSSQLWLIVVWEVCGPTWPWFFIPLTLWGFLLYIHYYKFLVKKPAGMTVLPAMPPPFGTISTESQVQPTVFLQIPEQTQQTQAPGTQPVVVMPTPAAPQLYPNALL